MGRKMVRVAHRFVGVREKLKSVDAGGTINPVIGATKNAEECASVLRGRLRRR
jgi:hypothetical protein